MRAFIVLPLLLSTALPAWGADTEAPTAVHTPTSPHVAGTPYDVEVQFTDPSGIFEPALLYRVGGSAFERVTLELDEAAQVYRAQVPARLLIDGARLEYYVEAYDQEGNGPARVGDEDAPLLVEVKVKVAPDPVVEPKKEEPEKIEPEKIEPVEVPPPHEGGGAGLWIGVGAAAVVLVAAGAVAGWYYFLRDDVPAEVRLQINGPSPVGVPLP